MDQRRVQRNKRSLLCYLESVRTFIFTGYYGSRNKDERMVQRKLLWKRRCSCWRFGQGKRERGIGQREQSGGKAWKGYLSVCKRKTSSRSVLQEGKCQGKQGNVKKMLVQQDSSHKHKRFMLIQINDSMYKPT